eukprot:scaffold4423_cov105-Isochrysis_galbana.AAC.11
MQSLHLQPAAPRAKGADSEADGGLRKLGFAEHALADVNRDSGAGGEGGGSFLGLNFGQLSLVLGTRRAQACLRRRGRSRLSASAGTPAQPHAVSERPAPGHPSPHTPEGKESEAQTATQLRSGAGTPAPAAWHWLPLAPPCALQGGRIRRR